MRQNLLQQDTYEVIVVIDALQKAVDFGDELGAQYVEIRAESATRSNIQYDDGRVSSISQRIEEGAAVRVLAEGTWGFVALSDLSKSSLKNGIKDAFSLAKSAAVARKTPIQLAEIQPVRDSLSLKLKQSPDTVEPQEKITYAAKLWEEVQRLDSRMKAITVQYRDGVGKKYLVTNEGTQLQLDFGLLYVFIRLTGKDGEKTTGARDEFGAISQGWDLLETSQAPDIVAKRIVDRVQKQLEGVSPKPGSFPCVLGPSIVGTLAHEALGHLAEADLTLQSAFAGKMQQRVAPDGVFMIDDGTMKEGIGSAKYDDEGVPTRRVEIIKDGMLNDLLTDREYAQRTGLNPSGNARAEDYRFLPLIRMRNTFFDRGDCTDEEIFEGIDFGYYCHSFAGGQTDLNATFQVGVQEAFEIADGKLTNSVTNLSISGIATEALLKIESIGKNTFSLYPGRCGKGGNEALISNGGPLIRFGSGSITFGGKG